MRYQTLYELMDLYEDDDIELESADITTAERVRSLTMSRLGPQAVSGPQKHGKHPMRRTARTVLIAAVLALALSVTAWAVYQARIADYILPEATAEAEPTAAVEPTAEPEQESEESGFVPVRQPPAWADFSLVGSRGTPEYEAYVEWTDYLEQAEPVDYAALDVDDVWHETPDNYWELYNAVTAEQADKLDEIMEEYGLTAHTSRALFNLGEADRLYDALDMEPVFPAEYTGELGGYLYDDGSFKLEAAGLEDELEFSIFVSVKGSFSMIRGTIGENYEEWGYTTSGGQTVDLILEEESFGTLLYETEGAYIFAEACYRDWELRRSHMSREQLEAFADSINFTALEKRFDGAEHGDTAQKVAELNEAQRQAQAEDMADWLAPFSTIEEQNEYVYAQLGDWRYPVVPEGYTYLWRNTTYAKGEYFLEWDLDNGVYFDEVDCGYRANSNESVFLFMGYVRYYADEGRTESVTRAQFEASRDYLARETVTVNGREAYFVEGSNRTTLTWLDEDRDLVFNLASDSWNTPPLSQTELIDLAELLMNSFT